MPTPSTSSAKKAVLHKKGHTTGRDYGNAVSTRKANSPRDLSVKK